MKRLLLYLWNFWPPYWGAGISIEHIEKDLRSVKVRLKNRPWTKNFVGTQFGGSIYSMTDPFYVVILITQLGRGYIVWDKSASVRFRKPSKTDLIAEFKILPSEIEDIKECLKNQNKMDWERDVLVKDVEGNLIAEVHKIIHIRKK